MSNKDIEQARKLSDNEMEGQKGGAAAKARTFANLERFFVTAETRSAIASFRGDLSADSVMCAGQTRSGDLAVNPSTLTQLRGGGVTLKF
jgi:hypothetical protein